MKKILHKSKQHTVRTLKHLRDHIVPHEANNHHPHLLKHRVLVGYSVLLVLLKVLAVVVPVVLPSSSLFSSAITSDNIVSLTNQTRENLGLNSLKVSDKLTQAANDKAQDMVANQYFAHVSPKGVTPWSWMAQVGYKYRYAGENLAVHFTSAEGVQEGWLASPSHRANIVNQNYTEIGIGVAMGEFEGFPTTFVVQMFGAPTETTQPVVAVTVPPATRAQPVVTNSPPVEQEPVAVPVTQPITEPVVVEPVSSPEPIAAPAVTVAPILDESTVVVMQQEGYYDIKLLLKDTDSAAAYLGDNWIQLSSSADNQNIWQGHLAYDQSVISQNGEQLYVVATSPTGTTERFTLAWVAPHTKVQNLYTFNEGSDRYAKLFGFFTVHNLNDSVRQFYFLFMVFLAAALLINIMVKIRIQKISIIGHTVFVLALALLLTIL